MRRTVAKPQQPPAGTVGLVSPVADKQIVVASNRKTREVLLRFGGGAEVLFTSVDARRVGLAMVEEADRADGKAGRR